MIRFVQIISVFLLTVLSPLLMAEPANTDTVDSVIDDMTIPPVASPKLVVIVAIDQLRPERIDATMPGGFGRLMREGHVFEDATLNHGVTNTCPGHVVMSTGVNPGKAGIPGNSYIDHDTMKSRYCVDDPDDSNAVYNTSLVRSPNALTATTIGSWLKQVSPQSRVFSVAGKDRAAITLGGKQADGAFWYNTEAAGFTTSKYYGEMPGYLVDFNQGDFFRRGFGSNFPEKWVHGEGKKRIDDYVGESQLHQRTSAHPLNMGETAERAQRVYFSPYVDVATGALAREVIIGEQLGQRGVTDLLTVSFSATDVVGHLYGPFSAESDDALAMLDQELGALLTLLDEVTGGDYLVALSADHGVLPLPEWLVEQGEMQCAVEGGRIDVEREGLKLYWHLYRHFTFPFSNPADLIAFSAAGLTINAAMAEELGVSVEEIVDSLESYYEGKPEIAAAWTHEELNRSSDPFARLYRNSLVVGKSPQLMLQMQPTCLAFREEGTSHGSPYLYDRKVPLIFFGRGVQPGNTSGEHHSTDIAPTLGHRLGLPMPGNLDGQALPVFNEDVVNDNAE